MVALLLTISFSIGFFIESIIGFGGGIIAYSILSLFSHLINVKEMIMAGLYIGTCSSAYIAYTGYKHFDKKSFLKIVPLSLVGVVIGVFAFSKLSPQALSLLFGILLISLAIKIMFFDHYVFPKIFQKQLIFIGGISQGAFGIGGPFWVNALARDFANKSALRTTMAVSFASFNIVRLIQLSAQNQLKLEFYQNIWWVIIPIFFFIYLGYRVHMKISETFFKKLIATMTILAGVKFLIHFF